jgi:hypothetical protein
MPDPAVVARMPIPTSEDDLGECIRFLRRNDYNDSQERVEMCLNAFRKSQKGARRTGPPTRGAPPPIPPMPPRM